MAQGVAWIAKQENVKCRVLVDDTTNQTKLTTIEGFDSDFTKCSAEEWWKVMVSHKRHFLQGHFVHPVCDPDVIAEMEQSLRGF